MQELVQHLASGQNLDARQITDAAAFLMDPQPTAETKATFLKALAAKGETPEEIAAFVTEFLRFAIDPGIDRSKLQGPMLDVVGTGGDRLNLFNISTTAMFIMAAGGVCMVKHGNRGITSKSGGADVLEALGVRIDLPVEKLAHCVQDIGVGFLFAPLYHPSFAAVKEARALLALEGQRSIFNILGPLMNPARPDYQLVGVFDPALTMAFGQILLKLGRKGAWVVHGTAGHAQGMDELSTLGMNQVVKLANGHLTEESLDPAVHKFAKPALEELTGGDAAFNADVLEGVLANRIKGAKRDIAVFNAAAGFTLTGKTVSLDEGRALAEEILSRGAAHVKLRELQDYC